MAGNIQLKTLATAFLALVLAAFCTGGGYFLSFELLNPYSLEIAGEPARSVALSGSDFRPLVFDEGRYEDDSSVLLALKNGEGILEATVDLQAEQLPFLRLDVRGLQASLNTVLYWRVEDRPGAVFGLPLQQARDGRYWFNLRQSADWRGRVTAVALGVYGDVGDTPFTLDNMHFTPVSIASTAAVIWNEWTGFRGWSHRSINAIRGIMPSALQYPTTLFAAWSLIAAIILAIVSRITPLAMTTAFATVILVPWLALDALWQLQLSTQLARTSYQFAGKSMPDRHRADLSPDLYEYAQHLQREVMPEVGTRVFLLENTPRMTYRRLKLQYFLLPHNIHNYDRLPRVNNLREGDVILALGENPELQYDEAAQQLTWQTHDVPASRLDSHPLGSVYRVRGAADD
ncbi:hypothetical protein [Parahalioglobus pacificus]|uniref:Uncharacterized protein n=1 Tax=Parahalioglobus pacificus TaxID=930806 RepID=A0A918XJL2_9GAMM|nr:hypothetical protein [Halioglobus pacificus]GHD33777.1 hypothetical protein GCM10007053_18670 [Halioglobus pacificus]